MFPRDLTLKKLRASAMSTQLTTTLALIATPTQTVFPEVGAAVYESAHHIPFIVIESRDEKPNLDVRLPSITTLMELA